MNIQAQIIIYRDRLSQGRIIQGNFVRLDIGDRNLPRAAFMLLSGQALLLLAPGLHLIGLRKRQGAATSDAAMRATWVMFAAWSCLPRFSLNRETCLQAVAYSVPSALRCVYFSFFSIEKSNRD